MDVLLLLSPHRPPWIVFTCYGSTAKTPSGCRPIYRGSLFPIHFGRRPGACALNCSTSLRRTSNRPPIFKVWKRCRFSSRAIACRETPRIRAASACEIHSSACSGKWVDIDNLFVIPSNLDSILGADHHVVRHRRT